MKLRDSYTTNERSPLMRLTTALLFITAIGVSAYSENDRPVVAGQTERPSQIAGKWKAGGINYEYEISQNGSTFSWQVTNQPSLNETARGEFTSKDSIKVTWTNRNGSDSATGRITSDVKGNATRIDWSNGIVFNRN